MKRKIYITMALSALTLAGCAPKEDRDSSAKEEFVEVKETVAEVDTLPLTLADFTSNIVSNGHARARESTQLYFRNPELVSEILVKNGQRVRKGETIARLDTYKLNTQKQSEIASVEQARLELKDILIGQGYDPDSGEPVPDEVMRLAMVRSGLQKAEASLNATLRDLEQTTLRAPYDGVIANVKGSKYSLATTSEPFCRIINDRVMDVEFDVLESEAAMISIGEAVSVSPFNKDESHTGSVTEINPMVDDKGHVLIKASVENARGLIDGMNVRIRINRSLGDRMTVPKKAVVLRTGKQVVFTYKDGKAMWNYVTTGLENIDSYEILDGLEPGMTVIVEGNENLAHEAPVAIIKKKTDKR